MHINPEHESGLDTPEYELFQRSQNGDTEAFRRIVESHQSYAYAIAFRFLGNETDAEDIVQESFINVWKHLAEYDPQKKFTTWLYRIVANRCLDFIKSRNRRRETFSTDPERVELRQSLEDPEKINDDRERLGMVNALVRELPEKQRMVFILRDLQDLNIKETSGILNMSKASVKSNLFHARKTLRQRIEQLDKTGL
jgi:RNA polymerase sigma-70 factor (ECF subfamily)